MIRQSQTITLLLCALLGTGCMSDAALGPDAGSVAQVRLTVRLSPNEATLFAAGSANTIRLWVEAFDNGATLPPGSYQLAYSSTSPEIASVSEDGLVTGLAPGLATIRATVTVGGVTRVATTRVTVSISPMDYWRISGTYDLVAIANPMPYLGTPAWGPSYKIIGVLTFPSTSDEPIFTDLRLLDDAGNPVYWVSEGSIRLNVPASGTLFGLMLGNDWWLEVQAVEKPAEGETAPPSIDGRLTGVFDNQYYSGWFSATLRGSGLDEK